MTIQDIVDRVNQKMFDELYSYDDIKFELDEAIDFINEHMLTTFPDFTSVVDGNKDLSSQHYQYEEENDDGDKVQKDYFPKKYLRQVVIPYTVAMMFSREGEFEGEYQSSLQQAHNGVGLMFREYQNKVPEQFKLEPESGIIVMDKDILNSDDDEDLDYRDTDVINWSINGDGDV